VVDEQSSQLQVSLDSVQKNLPERKQGQYILSKNEFEKCRNYAGSPPPVNTNHQILIKAPGYNPVASSKKPLLKEFKERQSDGEKNTLSDVLPML